MSEEVKPILNNRQYLDSWKKVFDLMRERRRFEARNDFLSFGREAGDEWKRAEQSSGELFRDIVTAKESFRKGVSMGLVRGKTFLLEELGERYGLVEFEKWISLSLLFSPDDGSKTAGVSPMLVVGWLNNSASYVDNLRRMVYFSQKSRLVSNNIINRVNIPKEIGGARVLLSPGFFDLVVGALNDEAIDWSRIEKAEEVCERGSGAFSMRVVT